MESGKRISGFFVMTLFIERLTHLHRFVVYIKQKGLNENEIMVTDTCVRVRGSVVHSFEGVRLITTVADQLDDGICLRLQYESIVDKLVDLTVVDEAPRAKECSVKLVCDFVFDSR